MIVTQRGVLPPVQFLELDSSLRNSMLSPAGTRKVVSADIDPLTATLQSTAAVGLQIDNDSGIIRFRTAAGTPVLEIEGDEISTNSIRTIGGKQLQIQDNNLVARLVVNATDGNVRFRSGGMGALSVLREIAALKIAMFRWEGGAVFSSTNVNSVVNSSTGVYNVDYTLAGFTASPTIIPHANLSGGSAFIVIPSTTTCSIQTYNSSTVLQDAVLNVIMLGI